MMDLIYNLATDRESVLSAMDKATATRLAVYMMYIDKHIIPRLQSRYSGPGGPAEFKAVYEKNREKLAAAVERNAARRQELAAKRALKSAVKERGAQASNEDTAAGSSSSSSSGSSDAPAPKAPKLTHRKQVESQGIDLFFGGDEAAFRASYEFLLRYRYHHKIPGNIPRAVFITVRPLLEEVRPVHIAQYGTSSLEMMDLLYNLATNRESALSSMDKETEKRLSQYIKYADDFVVPRLQTYHPGGLAELKAVFEKNREKIAAAVGKNEARRQELAARRAQKNSASTSVATGAEAGAPDPNEETAAGGSSSGSGDDEGGRGARAGAGGAPAGSGGAADVQGVGPTAGSVPSNSAGPDGPLKKARPVINP
eukprot:tig00020510_g9913.t1